MGARAVRDGRDHSAPMAYAEVFALGVSLLAGALLAVGGGQLQTHLLYVRRRRVAARLLFDDVIEILAAVRLNRFLLGDDKEPRAPLSTDDFEVDISLWKDHAATLAEVRDVEQFQTVRGAYGDALSLAASEPAAVVRWRELRGQELEAEDNALLAEMFPEEPQEDLETDVSELDDDLVQLMSREAGFAEAVDSLLAAAQLLGKWAGHSDADTDAEIKGTETLYEATEDE